MAPDAQQPKQNGMAALLTTLAQSGHQWVQLATVALVAISGLGNWVATWNSGDKSRQEIEISRRVAWEGEQRIKAELVKQVAEIHKWMQEATAEFHQGNTDSAANRKLLGLFKEELDAFEARQLAALNNQNAILRNQTDILNELHVYVKERQRDRDRDRERERGRGEQ
jgi:hypothetical protein